jgi:hypothetical protein
MKYRIVKITCSFIRVASPVRRPAAGKEFYQILQALRRDNVAMSIGQPVLFGRHFLFIKI